MDYAEYNRAAWDQQVEQGNEWTIPVSKEIIAEVWAFLAVLLGALLLMILVPDIVLWLPRLFGYQG